MMDYAVMGRKIKVLRALNRMTRKELAQKVGISANVLRNVERGESSIRFDVAVRLAEVFQISVSVLADPSLTSISPDEALERNLKQAKARLESANIHVQNAVECLEACLRDPMIYKDKFPIEPRKERNMPAYLPELAIKK